jgi:predicted glycoside hydrolase/deacetylase ChbG (UPF0249 family)
MMFPNGTCIVNADDFGMSTTINRAIVECFHRGLISSATLMANMPGFEDACQQIHAGRLQKRVGIHLNLTDGQPLRNATRNCREICDADGNFRRFRSRWFSRSARQIIAREIDAQIQRCREADVPLTHADSHQHVHNEPLVLLLVLAALRRHNVRYLRITRNMDRHSLMSAKAVAKSLYNSVISASGRRGTRWFGSVENFAALRATGCVPLGSFEILTHPSLNDQGVLIDHLDGLPLAERLRTTFQGLQLVSYSGQPTEITAGRQAA